MSIQYPSLEMHQLSQRDWVAIVAHRLHSRWRSAEPTQLEEVACEIWQDERLRELGPAQAADTWLAPINER